MQGSRIRDAAAPAQSRDPLPRQTDAALRLAEVASRPPLIERAPMVLVEQFLIARKWHYMAPMMACCMGLMAAFLASLPPFPSIVCVGLAIAIVCAAEWFVAFERAKNRPGWQRVSAMCVAVALPMLLFGAGVTHWAAQGLPGAWIPAIGAHAAVAMFAAIQLSGRLTSVLAAGSVLWLSAALHDGATAGGAILMAGVAGSALLLRRLIRLRDAIVVQQRKADVERARALEILIDYEQTGQGWFWETDAHGAITYVSPKIGELLGRPAPTLIGRSLAELFVPGEDEDEVVLLLARLVDRVPFQDIALRAAAADRECWWSLSGRPLFDEAGGFVGFRGFGADLTERRRSEEHAARLAMFDSLTGLANRFQMSQKLEAIIRAAQPEKRVCGVFLLDLDRFKQVNDTLGHQAGDTLLQQVADRLERSIDRAGRVGRLGGDEFQIILPGLSDREALSALAQRTIEAVSQDYLINGQRVVIGASIGIAVSPHDGLSSDALVRNADLALYAAKDRGRGRYHFYAADLHSDAEERRQLEHDLRDALTHAGLELYYQPIVHTATERITGFEALLRWHHPALGPLSPAKFIPIAEDAGLIGPIGEWALRTACRDLATWPESIRVAVNVSALQFANPGLPAIVTSALAEAQVAPERLELEITESVFLSDHDGLDAIFAALKTIGVRLALDDFGTGYSSLGYLKKAPFDKIKIDQSFVRGATVEGSRNGAIIASIVSLAEALGMETTAEGVETLDELDLVRRLGCSHIQGFIYEAPLSAAAASERINSGLTAIAHGPRASTGRSHTRSRRITIHCEGQSYRGKVHNFSAAGAMIEASPEMPPGAQIGVEMTAGEVFVATVRWCEDGRMGVEFLKPFDFEGGKRRGASGQPPPASASPVGTGVAWAGPA